jgi:phenylpropionate dioxygenase-like ring-hydroxylating dioxygenase large terminal subunit
MTEDAMTEDAMTEDAMTVSTVDVAASGDLDRGAIVAVEAFGEKLALFRTEAGTARVVGRFCPHLGANLARLGRVKGELLVCSSHKWTYDGNGHCVAAPGEDEVPDVCLRSYATHELDGRIIVTQSPKE